MLFELLKTVYSTDVIKFILYFSMVFGPFMVLWFLSILSIRFEKNRKI